jgi:hypothetical protein
MTRTPLPVSLLVLALAAAVPARAGELADDILVANDPVAAGAFMSSPELQADFKARAPEKFEPVFARAAELKDMSDLLLSARDAASIRLALVIRPECQFCQRSTTMWAWIDKYYPTLWPERRKEMHAVYWDWDGLQTGQIAWLLSHGVSATAWTDLDLAHRRDALEGWAKEESAALMALNPKNQVEAFVMQRRISGVYSVLGGQGAAPLWDRLAQVNAGLSGLERVKKALGRSSSEGMKKAYAEAQNAPTPEARLAALSCIYDGEKVDLAAVRALAPPGEGQTFDPRTRALVADLLKTGLMNDTDGTWAGKDLREFFATHPMKVAIEPTTLPVLAWYDADVLHFNEKFITEFVKSHGRTLDDLVKEPALLQPLLLEIVPVFVHEATHQRQDAFAKAAGIPFYSGESAEKEAMMNESLFVLQKSKLDPSYAAFLEKNQDSSTNVREALMLARRLLKDRAAWFGETVMARHYPEYLSLAGNVWCRVVWHNQLAPPIEAELRRRAALPADARARADAGRAFKGEDLVDAASFSASLPSISTVQLNDILERQRSALKTAPDAYSAYAKRLQDVTALTDARLDQLANPAAKADAVPSPTGWRKD